jgi:hypothetical protein
MNQPNKPAYIIEPKPIKIIQINLQMKEIAIKL